MLSKVVSSSSSLTRSWCGPVTGLARKPVQGHPAGFAGFFQQANGSFCSAYASRYLPGPDRESWHVADNLPFPGLGNAVHHAVYPAGRKLRLYCDVIRCIDCHRPDDNRLWPFRNAVCAPHSLPDSNRLRSDIAQNNAVRPDIFRPFRILQDQCWSVRQ